jgi:adenosylhomocysteinase
MDGYAVMKMSDAAPLGDIFICATGCRDIITLEHMQTMKDRAILCNAGHFDVEVDVAGLSAAAVSSHEARQNVIGYVLPSGKTVHVIAEGRLVNIAAADGHPAEIMDMSFAVQFYSALYVAENHGKLPIDVIDVSDETDNKIAFAKLAAWDISIDALTKEQEIYLASWDL